jgi:3-dehydroquinate synthase
MHRLDPARPRPDRVLRHGGGETALYLGAGALERAAPALREWTAGRQAFVVSSPAIAAAQGPLVEAIEGLAEPARRLLLPDGEAAKTLASAEALWTAMLDAGGTRDSRVIAVGGGSLTDVAGFAAATFLRGIGLALVPTTLLAQVDAAIGGKTAIDLPAAKNSVGAFWHPALVVADSRPLATLDPAEWRSGLVEVVKIAAATDPRLFERLEEVVDGLAPGPCAGGGGHLEEVVGAAIDAKIRIVESDPAEAGPRRVLNLGHTLGHAIESALGYRRLRHGEAVAYGLLFALRLAAARGASPDFAARCEALLARLGMPPLPPLDPERVMAALRHDKKARRDGLRWILPMDLGRVDVVRLAPEAVRADLEGFLAAPWRR